MGQFIIDARGLTKRYGLRPALAEVDLQIVAGESLAVFGPNGAGKTTLLRMLATNLRPTSGSLTIAGRDARRSARETRADIGVISHASFLYDDLSGLDNLLFFGRLHGCANPRERAEELLDQLGLSTRADDPVRAYSRGMQQRLSVARALMHDPRIVFLDEPFSGLDPQGSSVLADLLLSLRAGGRTLIMTTHDLPRGIALSDRWIILSRGRTVGEGRSADQDGARFEELYFERLMAPAAQSAAR